MAKIASDIASWVSRFIKSVMVVVLVPMVLGLLHSILDQLEIASASGSTFRECVVWGFVTYVGLHLLLYRPVPMFQVSHRIFSVLAVWLFGGQVASVETAETGKGKSAKGAKRESAAQGSTLVAFSPYVIPLYAVLISASGLLLRHWFRRTFVDGPVSFLIGAAMAFHWLMTADDLQRQRERWHVETYLLAIGLVFLMTLLLAGASLPWGIPEFSFIKALDDGVSNTMAIYTTLIQRLFF
jgi:hypothetical protein